MKSVLAFGTFDGLHPGHAFYLREAKKHGRLTVVVALDETVQEVKGKFPRNSQEKRLADVAALPFVDNAVLGYPGDKHRILEELRPDVICLGYDQHSFTAGLDGKNVEIVRIPAYKPETYKSSRLR